MGGFGGGGVLGCCGFDVGAKKPKKNKERPTSGAAMCVLEGYLRCGSEKRGVDRMQGSVTCMVLEGRWPSKSFEV